MAKTKKNPVAVDEVVNRYAQKDREPIDLPVEVWEQVKQEPLYLGIYVAVNTETFESFQDKNIADLEDMAEEKGWVDYHIYDLLSKDRIENSPNDRDVSDSWYRIQKLNHDVQKRGVRLNLSQAIIDARGNE